MASGFTLASFDPCVFLASDIVLGIYIDDVLIAGSPSCVPNFMKDVSMRFKFKDLDSGMWSSVCWTFQQQMIFPRPYPSHSPCRENKYDSFYNKAWLRRSDCNPWIWWICGSNPSILEWRDNMMWSGMAGFLDDILRIHCCGEVHNKKKQINAQILIRLVSTLY